MNVDKLRFDHSFKEPFCDLIEPSDGIKSKMNTYVAFSPFTGLTKIGRSSNYEYRIMGISSTLGLSLTLITVFNEDCEASLHKFYAHKNDHGEWFKLTDFDHYFLTEISA